MDCFIEARSIAELNRKKLSAMKPGDLGGAGAEARMGGVAKELQSTYEPDFNCKVPVYQRDD